MKPEPTPDRAIRPQLKPVGVIRSTLKSRRDAPKQGSEGAPDAWLEVHGWAADALHLLAAGDAIVVITWFHQSKRNVLQVHPRSNLRNPLTGVFATRSPDRPNPLGLHPVTIRSIKGTRLRIGPIEAIDGTPVVDIKPDLLRSAERPLGYLAVVSSPLRASRAPVRTLADTSEVTSVANIEVQIPKELGLTPREKAALQKSFQKQLVETLRGKHSSAIAKSKLMVVDVRAKSKNEVV